MRILAFLAVCLLSAAVPARAGGISDPSQPVKIEGYSGEAMEPFISRDGRYLFFNTRNDPGANTNIHFAEKNGGDFIYRGLLAGTISYDLDAVPTMSADGHFCFVSPRDYRRTLISVLCGTFDGTRVNDAEPQRLLQSESLGHLIFDVELAANGQTMIFAEGTFSGDAVPDAADLHLATLTPNGFKRSPDSAKILASVNSDDLEYAPALSADGLDLYFTRVTGFWLFRAPKLFHAHRASVNDPFGKPHRLDAIEGFVEGASVAPDGTLYFHKRVSDHFDIWHLPK